MLEGILQFLRIDRHGLHHALRAKEEQRRDAKINGTLAALDDLLLSVDVIGSGRKHVIEAG